MKLLHQVGDDNGLAILKPSQFDVTCSTQDSADAFSGMEMVKMRPRFSSPVLIADRIAANRTTAALFLKKGILFFKRNTVANLQLATRNLFRKSLGIVSVISSALRHWSRRLASFPFLGMFQIPLMPICLSARGLARIASNAMARTRLNRLMTVLALGENHVVKFSNLTQLGKVIV